MAAQEHELRLAGKLLHHALIKRAPARGKVDTPLPRLHVRLAGVHNGLSQHHHARAAAEGVIVGILMLVLRIGADVDQFDLEKPLFQRPANDGFA